jgi:carboxymethylenebutenolidase
MRTITTEWVEVGDGTGMQAYLATPEGPGPFPGILIFQEAFGVNAHIRDVAERFAREGYVALAPEIFYRTAPHGFEGSYTDFSAVMPHYQALTDDTLISDLKDSYAWLSGPGGTLEISAIGFCLGGRLSFLANSVVKLKAAVSFYGGGIAPALLDRAALQQAPILLIWGGLDKHLPPEQTASVARALRDAGKTYVQADFSAADHGFFCDARASYHPASAAQAWALALQFIKQPE